MSRQRGASPTTAICQQRQEAREQMATMVHMGLHVFNPEWQRNKGGAGRIFSPTFRQITLKIFGKSDTITFPVQTCTKVADVKAAISKCLMLEQEKMDFLVKQGCNTRKQRGPEEIASAVTVKGITSFRAQPHRWPSPMGVIGCGYGGQKTMMTYAKDGNADGVVCFERLSGIGGFNWLHAANKTSKLQTELGSFHIWWGEEFVKEGCGYPDADRWGIWPDRATVLEHMRFAAEQYGILPHIHFDCEVVSVELLGRLSDADRQYLLVAKSSKDSRELRVTCSGVWGFPGIMTRNRIVDYPGEDVFEGVIAYGMGGECPYEKLAGRTAMVLGNGAFAVENARTCIEYEAAKVYIVTRRKSLAAPRFPCWFSHQAPLPTPGWLILRMFEPMYELATMGDPWKYYSVHANKDRTTATIIQGTRFGIGDVTFLMCCYGKLEFWEDTVKRLTEKIVYLDSGRKLEGVGAIIKALGLLGDHNFDKVMKMKKVVGSFCDGDWRRPFNVDPTGMHAANFATFSSGVSFKDFARTHKFLFDFPRVMQAAESQGFMESLPSNAANVAEDKPAYAVGVLHVITSAMLVGSFCPETVQINAADEAYKHRMYHRSHGTQYFLSACVAEWNEYQNKWRRQGSTKEFVPYPYTMEMIERYFATYSKHTGWATKPSGPPEDAPPIRVPEVNGPPGRPPDWVNDDAAMKGMEMQVNEEEQKWWWVKSGAATDYDAFLRKERKDPIAPGRILAAPGWWQDPEEKARQAALEQQAAEEDDSDEEEQEEEA